MPPPASFSPAPKSMRRSFQPSGTATIFRERRWTWREVAERIGRLAGGLAKLGVAKGDRVAILAMNSDRYWEAMYAIQFLSLEFFFRGFMLQGLRRAFGSGAIVVMMVPYCMIHYGKPMPETFGAIGAGLILGTLAMRTRSIWGGVMIHVGVAWTMDLLAVSQCPTADSGRPCPTR